MPKRAGDQARKVIVVEAVRVGTRHYAVGPGGRNARLVSRFDGAAPWRERRRGWTLPDLADSLCGDTTVGVAAFDFPFSIPTALLDDGDFAQMAGQPPFRSRVVWAQFVSSRLALAFDDDSIDAELGELGRFDGWKDKRFWARRATDRATGGSPPLKHKFQNVFAMTIAGAAFLTRLESHGYTLRLDTATAGYPGCVFETYPRAVAQRVGFVGSYKADPEASLSAAVRFLAGRRVRLDFNAEVRHFCETYRTSANDPDGADAFLCLVTAIACSEGFAEVASGDAGPAQLLEEGSIVVPRPVEASGGLTHGPAVLGRSVGV